MIFYRYETQYSAGGSNSIQLELFKLIKETDKGYWIKHNDFDMYKKWIPKVSLKRFAYPTKKEALINYIKRNEKRNKILKSQLRIVSSNIKMANELLKEIQ